jgi:hypothetical protein
VSNVTENWKAVVGFEGLYEVSDLGRVRSLDRVKWCGGLSQRGHWRKYKGQMLRPGACTKQGHLSVVLGHGLDGRPVHTLVLAAFVGPCPRGQEGLHGNGVAADNRLVNLRYGTRGENNRDATKHGRRRLTLEQAKGLRAQRGRGVTYRELGEEFGVCQSQAYNIASGAHYNA